MADECQRCKSEIARLIEENASLRRTAVALGSVAERLNAALKEERRSNRAAEQDLAKAGGSRP